MVHTCVYEIIKTEKHITIDDIWLCYYSTSSSLFNAAVGTLIKCNF